MKETLIDIVESIDSCATARQGKRIYAIARVHLNLDGKNETYWFTQDGYSHTSFEELRRFGHFVPKNSDLAIKMQTMEVGGSHEYDHKDRTKRMKHHRITLENRSIFQNQTIEIAGDLLKYQYRNIKDFLSALQQNQKDIQDIESQISELQKLIDDLKNKKDSAHQRGQITRSIKELQKEYRVLTQQQEDLKNITIYIRKQGEMRYSLIVDPIQTRIKTQNLFDGKTVIINGGPGTGKSTTMIHRLAYLTDKFALKEDTDKNIFNFKLNALQRRQLQEAIKANRDWMFFSPSNLLRDYLATAMSKERLSNTSQKVWNWKDYCRMILQVHYRLLGDDNSKAPFRVCKIEDTLFYQKSNIINELIEFFLNQLRKIKDQLPQIDSDNTVYEWTSIAINIHKRFESCDKYDLGAFISLFDTLESVYGEDCKRILKEKNEVITNLSNEICTVLEKNKKASNDMNDILDLTSEDEESDNHDEAEDVSESISPKTETKSKLKVAIESWIKEYSYCKVTNNSNLSDVHELVCTILLPVINGLFDQKIQKIGQMMVFEQYAQYTRGVKAILLAGIPVSYKKFRTYLIKNKYNGCNNKLLRDIMQRKQGKELHHQELSLILGFINTLAKQIKGITGTKIKHTYIEAYDEVARPIIGIDEATDFSICDIYAMQSLLLREFNSLTLCGDMMQRLTTYGINSWSELNGIVPEPTIVEMKTSYRQSKKVLDVARNIYSDTLGVTPTYTAFMKSNKVPDPLVYIDGNEGSKIRWISKRISEVYRAYGEQLPSIAIFVNDKGYIPAFIASLKNTEFFTQKGIDVIDGSISKNRSENHICVYPIEVVKGMEFDVVFFHNIDNASVDNEILKRYIYVGVSRAAFFLGITLKERNEEICKYFKEYKDWFKI